MKRVALWLLLLALFDACTILAFRLVVPPAPPPPTPTPVWNALTPMPNECAAFAHAISEQPSSFTGQQWPEVRHLLCDLTPTPQAYTARDTKPASVE